MESHAELEPCPSCGKREGKLLGSRFPYYVKCNRVRLDDGLSEVVQYRRKAVE